MATANRRGASTVHPYCLTCASHWFLVVGLKLFFFFVLFFFYVCTYIQVLWVFWRWARVAHARGQVSDQRVRQRDREKKGEKRAREAHADDYSFTPKTSFGYDEGVAKIFWMGRQKKKKKEPERIEIPPPYRTVGVLCSWRTLYLHITFSRYYIIYCRETGKKKKEKIFFNRPIFIYILKYLPRINCMCFIALDPNHFISENRFSKPWIKYIGADISFLKPRGCRMAKQNRNQHFMSDDSISYSLLNIILILHYAFAKSSFLIKQDPWAENSIFFL